MTVNITNVSLAGGAGLTGFAGSIRGEFPSGVNPTSLSEFYRGGLNVSINQGDAGYGLISTSGPISFGSFRNQDKFFNFGNSGWEISCFSANVIAPGFAVSVINFTSDGNLTTTGSTTPGGSLNMTPLPSGQWYNPITSNIGDSYWIRFDLISSSGSGIEGGAPLGVWTQLSSGATKDLTVAAGSGAGTRTYNVQISSDSAGTNIVTSGTMVLESDGT